ncbi:MAG: helix-turn-helix transcriptional regulator [Clostridia bacterium]|nr:helix-turn-helix transcriptional regulator [Clostridia bacterium]
MNMKEVGERIKTLREKKYMNRNQLANNAGVSPTYIYQLERGEKSPTVEYLNNICWGLGITIEEFFATEKKDNPIFDKLSELSPQQKCLLNKFLSSL